jgi:hypothetical protein
VVPMPGEAKVYLPGLALSRSTSSDFPECRIQEQPVREVPPW